MTFPVTDNVVKTARHTTFYLACGAVDAPAIIFVAGHHHQEWPRPHRTRVSRLL